MYFCPTLLPNKAAHTAGPWVFESCAFGFSTVPAPMLENSQSRGSGAIALSEKGNEEPRLELQDTSVEDLLRSKLAPD